MSMKELIDMAVGRARLAGGLGAENYWLYVKKDGTHAFAVQDEKKTEGYIGFFVEDDTRLQGITGVAEKKIKKMKYGKQF